MGKLVPVDAMRPRPWPSIPANVSPLEPVAGSTDIVCHICGGPSWGLIYDAETDTFKHREQRGCDYYLKASRR